MGQVHNQPHPVLALVHRSEKYVATVDRGLGQVDLGNTAVRVVAGTHAFRDYNWLTNAAATNTSRNLRGMVVSAKWRTVFRFFSDESKYMKYMQNIGLLAGFAAGIAEASHEFERLAESKDPAVVKGARMAAIAGTAAQRALLGAVPAGTHMIYQSLQGWCMIAGLAGGKLESGANQCIATLKNADAFVESTFKAVTDTSNQAKLINHPGQAAGAVAQGAKDVWIVVDTVLSPRSGK